jgi:nitroimidazol reductase NimA-like FMN-containing flavoprotein (pyridoxamine 5'-phosphate oxidase superfamily)
MLEQMKSMARAKSMCVLATVGGGKPHCSLMAYITDDDCREIVMFTPQRTKKYRNVTENKKVSLLIDDRGDTRRQYIRALTVYGECEPVTDAEKKRRLLARFSAVHPHLEDFLRQSDIVPLSIKITAFLLLDGPSQAHFVDLTAGPG